MKGTHTIGFQPAKIPLFHKPARGGDEKSVTASPVQPHLLCGWGEYEDLQSDRHAYRGAAVGRDLRLIGYRPFRTRPTEAHKGKNGD